MVPAKSVINIRPPLKSRACRARVACAGVGQSFDVRTIQVRAHHAHSFAVAPVEFPARLFEMELLRRECLAFANYGYAILTIEISALNRTIVPIRNAHVCPVNVSGFKIDDDAIWDSSSADNDFSVRSIGVSRMNPATACFKAEQATNSLVCGCDFGFGNFCNGFHALIS